MKKIFKSLVTGLVVAGMTATTMLASVSADEATKEYVTVSVEKFSIGQGYVFEPVTVELKDGDKGMDVLKRAVGEENIIVTSSDWGSYISGFKDTDSGEVKLAKIYDGLVSSESLTARTTEGALSELDYTSEAGFMFFVNGASAMEGIDSYTPKNGDVIQMCFTIYNYGADIGIDNSSWGGSVSLIGEVSRVNLTKAIAQANGENVDAKDAVAVISNLDSTQNDIDKACESLLKKIEDANAKPDNDPEIKDDNTNTDVDNSVNDKNDAVETPSNEDKTPQTGLVVSLVSPCVLGACAVMCKKRKD